MGVRKMILEALFYPGMAFIIFMSFIYSGILRKVAARMQNRIGPPIWQPLLDFLKLLGKEDVIPEQAKPGFTLWPFVAAASVIVAGFMIPMGGSLALPFGSNVLIIFYFLAMSSVALYLAGFSSSNPFAVVGSMRKITQAVGYEFPFLISVIVPALYAGSMDPLAISSFQSTGLWMAGIFPLSFIAFIVAMLAKTETPPFHVPGAHQEIVAGYYTEYTGTRLAFIELTHFVKLFVLISLGVALFMGSSPDIFSFIIKGLLLLFITVLARTVFARLRIDHVLRVAWLFGAISLIDLVRVILW
jgi:NADH-quinone oxidoreductase subunit H